MMIRRRCGVVIIAEKFKEVSLRWFGHVMRSGEEQIKSIMELNTEGNRGRSRPKKRLLDCVKEELDENRLTSDITLGRKYWRDTADPGTVWIRAV